MNKTERTIEKNNQLFSDSRNPDKINERLANEIRANSTADVVSKLVLKEIVEFQSTLPPTEDVVLITVTQGIESVIFVEEIGHIGYSLIAILGKDINDRPAEIVQHISQLNIQISSRPSEKSEERQEIGFRAR